MTVFDLKVCSTFVLVFSGQVCRRFVDLGLFCTRMVGQHGAHTRYGTWDSLSKSSRPMCTSANRVV